MKKFSESQISIFESPEPLDFVALFEKMKNLKSWLYTSTGLGMMSIIDEIFKEYNYETPLNQNQIDKFNRGLDLLKRTQMPLDHINLRLSQKLPGGIQSKKLVLDKNGDYINGIDLNQQEGLPVSKPNSFSDKIMVPDKPRQNLVPARPNLVPPVPNQRP